MLGVVLLEEEEGWSWGGLWMGRGVSEPQLSPLALSMNVKREERYGTFCMRDKESGVDRWLGGLRTQRWARQSQVGRWWDSNQRRCGKELSVTVGGDHYFG